MALLITEWRNPKLFIWRMQEKLLDHVCKDYVQSEHHRVPKAASFICFYVTETAVPVKVCCWITVFENDPLGFMLIHFYLIKILVFP